MITETAVIWEEFVGYWWHPVQWYPMRSIKMITGYLDCDYGRVVLADDLSWHSDDPGLAMLAQMYAPAAALSEADGDPVAALLGRLQAKLGGEFTIKQEWRAKEAPA